MLSGLYAIFSALSLTFFDVPYVITKVFASNYALSPFLTIVHGSQQAAHGGSIEEVATFSALPLSLNVVRLHALFFKHYEGFSTC